MNFDFSPEQHQLADAVKRWADKAYSFEHRRSVLRSERGCDDADWRALASLGLTALALPEASGGFEGTTVDLLVVMQALGPCMLLEPLSATIVAAEALRLAGGHDGVLKAVAAGDCKLATAFGERQARHDLADVAVTAAREGDGWRIRGEKTMVLHGSQVDRLVVSARTSGGTRDASGITLFLVDAAGAGIARKTLRTVDGLRADMLVLDTVVQAGACVGAQGEGHRLLDNVADFAAVIGCAEGVGVMEALNAATLEYLRTRQQFGAPLGRQQVLQHRMVDMFIALEQARSLTLLAAMRAAGSDAAQRSRAVAAAKVQVSEALQYVGEQAVHLHGGIGMTDELPVSHLFKRATMLAMNWGDPAHHIARFIAQPEFRHM
ncbi:acyl-CoA dehydrogenase [soil metagenome]